jgi:hypothetical protein
MNENPTKDFKGMHIKQKYILRNQKTFIPKVLLKIRFNSNLSKVH